jgi:hypothetical protein
MQSGEGVVAASAAAPPSEVSPFAGGVLFDEHDAPARVSNGRSAKNAVRVETMGRAHQQRACRVRKGYFSRTAAPAREAASAAHCAIDCTQTSTATKVNLR